MCCGRERRVIGLGCGEFHYISILGKGLGLSWKVLGIQDLLKACREFELLPPVVLVFNSKCMCICMHTSMYMDILVEDVHKRKK